MRPLLTVALAAALVAPTGAAAQAAEQGDLPPAFVRRAAKKGAGKFYTAAELAKVGSTDAPQLLARVSGGSLKDIGGGDVVLVGRRGNRNSLSASIDNELCRIGVAVNDTRQPDSFDIRTLKIDEIIALEFYSGPSTIPPELGATNDGSAQCGMFVLWLKSR